MGNYKPLLKKRAKTSLMDLFKIFPPNIKMKSILDGEVQTIKKLIASYYPEIGKIFVKQKNTNTEGEYRSIW